MNISSCHPIPRSLERRKRPWYPVPHHIFWGLSRHPIAARLTKQNAHWQAKNWSNMWTLITKHSILVRNTTCGKINTKYWKNLDTPSFKVKIINLEVQIGLKKQPGSSHLAHWKNFTIKHGPVSTAVSHGNDCITALKPARSEEKRPFQEGYFERSKMARRSENSHRIHIINIWWPSSLKKILLDPRIKLQDLSNS